jgi:hypothetical protein
LVCRRQPGWSVQALAVNRAQLVGTPLQLSAFQEQPGCVLHGLLRSKLQERALPEQKPLEGSQVQPCTP